MFNIKQFLFLIFVSFTQLVFAGETVKNISVNETSKAEIKINLIEEIRKDGYVSDKMADKIKHDFIKSSDYEKIYTHPSSVKEAGFIEKYATWSNFFKIFGIGLLLIAFSGLIKQIILACYVFIVAIPPFVYQGLFATIFTIGVIKPSLILESQSFYIALFSSIANLLVLGWSISTYPKVFEKFKLLFNFGIPVECILNFYGMIYFGVLAFTYQSSTFGLFSAICLSGIFSFGLKYYPGTLYLDFKENFLNVVIWGHLIVLMMYLGLYFVIPQYTTYFDFGIQYYCSLALAVGLIVGSSPFYSKSKGLYAVLFTILVGISSYFFYIHNIKPIFVILMFFYILLIIEWIGYYSFKTNFIIGCAVSGAILYTIALLIEKYSYLIN
jgi:hypothetical protein